MNSHALHKAIICLALIFFVALVSFAPGAHAMSGTSRVALPGIPVSATPGWPEGVLDLVNDPLRTDGWNSWFSELPNDVNRYEFKVRDTDDVNRLLKSLAAIKSTNVTLRLNPGNGYPRLDSGRKTSEKNQAAMVFAIGNQKQLNEWYQQLKEVEPGVRKLGQWEFKQAPVALPPTLTLYVGHEAIDLNKLKVPDKVDVVSDAVPTGKAPEQTVKAIEKFLANLKSNRQSRAGLPASAPESKDSAKPDAKKSVTKKVAGRITNEAGKPLDRVRWRISAFEEWQDDHWELNHDIYTGQQPEFFTDGEGRFELKFSRQVRLDLQFDKSGFAPAFLYQVAPDAGDLHVVMQRGVPVRGSVVLADSEQPVKGQRVVMLRLPTRGWWFQTWTYLSSEGTFEFRVTSPPNEPGRAKPAQWQIEYAGQSIPIDVREGEPVNVRVKVAVSAHKSEGSSRRDSVAWVENCLNDFESIKVGSTRRELKHNFKLDGGLQGASAVRFCHPACPYFKVDVEFDFKRYAADQNRAVAGNDDKVLRVSKPYLERTFNELRKQL